MSSSHSPAKDNTLDSRLACFFQSCEREFRFLEQDHNFSYLSGLAQYRQGRLVFLPYKAGGKDENPEAVTLYEKNRVALEISYEADKSNLQIYFRYDRIYRFEIAEILKAHRKPALSEWRALQALLPDTLQNALKTAAAEVQHNVELLENLSPDAIQKILNMREKLMQQKIRDQHKQDIENAIETAVKAFALKDYRRVVEILTPHEQYLNFAAIKKLEIARKYLLGE